MHLRRSMLTFPVLAGLEFRRGGPHEIEPVESALPDVAESLSGIRCPICQWSPLRSSRWVCSDCDYPEYFYAGCGTEWNTFETRGLCPTCLHRWAWTSCLSCRGWSRHRDWYTDENEPV